MTRSVQLPPRSTFVSKNWIRETVSWLAGASFTALLLVGISQFQNKSPQKTRAPALDDLTLVSLAEPPPPPPPVVTTEAVAPQVELGIPVGASESPVKLAVPPPTIDLQAQAVVVAPPASIQIVPPAATFRPRIDQGEDTQHVYQTREVDQIPSVLMRVTPLIPRDVRNNAIALRVNLLLIVRADGTPENVRVVTSSGNPVFDTIVANTLKEWTFSPAIRKGKAVRCLLQQSVTIRWTGGSPFQT